MGEVISCVNIYTRAVELKIFCRWLTAIRLSKFSAIGVNAAGVTGVRTPPIIDLQGFISVLDPAIISTQSRVRCTIFVIIIDFLVNAVVEQVYSSTFKFCLLKIQEICPLKCLIFTYKYIKMRLVAGLCPDPLGDSAPPDP